MSFLWFKQKYYGEIDVNLNFIDFLRTESKKDIIERKVCIPIDNISIQEPFEIGNIRFDFFKKEQFDEIEREWAKSKDRKDSSTPIKKFRKEYQGKVYAEFILEAEEKKCIELANQETEKAIMVLSCYSGTVFFPEIPSYFGRLGKKNIPISHSLIFEGNKLSHINQNVEIQGVFEWPIKNELIVGLKRDGLDKASQLLKKKELSNLEMILLNAFYLFSRCVFSDNFHDKLVYALVTLETLLLQNTSEPIQSNVGLRLAFLTANNSEKRKTIKKLINDAYSLRSSFIHHGKQKENYELLKEVQLLVYLAIRNILFNLNKYKTQKELLSSIENAILS